MSFTLYTLTLLLHIYLTGKLPNLLTFGASRNLGYSVISFIIFYG